MNNYVIFTDASADVDRKYVAAHDIRFVPMHYTLGAEDRTTMGPEKEDVLSKHWEEDE